MRRVVLHLVALPSLLLALCLLAPVPAAAGSSEFPSPPSLQPQVRFWTRIYSEVGTDGALIHDADNLDVVYERVDFPDDLGGREVDRRYEATKEKYRQILRKLAEGKRTGLSREEERVLRLFPDRVSNRTLRTAAENVRLQRGQANRFREGVIRAGAWEPFILETLKKKRLPEEIATLPHVESSFNPEAYSKVGAAGMWQFMPRTARQFMRVDSVVDERMDPFIATEGAADYLRQNYGVVGTWPLALTAYNHGAGGILKAKRQLGTSDIARIVREYRGPSFGFASRNFYTSFLAAREVSTRYPRYFGPLQRQAPVQYEVKVLDRSYSVGTLRNALGIDLDTLRTHNLALRDPFWNGKKRLPAGVTVRIPKPGPPAAPVSVASLEAAAVPNERDEARLAAAHAAGAEAEMAPAPAAEVAQTTAIETEPPEAADPAPARGMEAAPRRWRAAPPLEPGSALAVAAAELPAEPLAPAAQVEPAPVPDAVMEAVPAVVAEIVAAPVPTLADLDAPVVPDGATEAVPIAAAPAAEAPPVAPDPAPVRAAAQPAALARAIADLRRAEAAAEAEAEAEAATSDVAAPAPAATPEQELARAGFDESRYRVGAKNTVMVQPDENLTLLGTWTGVSPDRIRSLNKLRRKSVGIGQKLRLDFSKVSKQRFEARRIAYHQVMRDRFFENFQVASVEQRVVRKGDTLWSLSRGPTPVPAWLLRHYNPDVDFQALRPGKRVVVPRIERRES